MTLESIVVWIIIGGIAGLLAEWLIGGIHTGCIGTVIVGIIGAFIGGCCSACCTSRSVPGSSMRSSQPSPERRSCYWWSDCSAGDNQGGVKKYDAAAPDHYISRSCEGEQTAPIMKSSVLPRIFYLEIMPLANWEHFYILWYRGINRPTN